MSLLQSRNTNYEIANTIELNIISEEQSQQSKIVMLK